MDKVVPLADNGALEFIRGEYAVLPTRLSRHTRILNAGIRNTFHRTRFCLETQRRKFCSYHSVEAAKHHSSLLNLRKTLKTRPWRSNTVTDSTPDSFTADVSHLNPVELSRFQLMREVVAAIPGEKVTMGEICERMRQTGPVFTEDKEHNAVLVEPQRLKPLSRRASPKLYCPSEEDSKQEELAGQELEDVQEHPPADQIFEVTSGSESVITSGDLARSLTDDVMSNSGEDTVSVSNPHITRDNGGVSETASTAPSDDHLPVSSSTENQNPPPVFITEVNYIPLKTHQRKGSKATNISNRKHQEVIPFKPKLPRQSDEKKFQRQRVDAKNLSSENTFPVIRKTDPYGLSYKGGRVEEPQKKIVHHKLGPAKLSHSTNNLDSAKRVKTQTAPASSGHDNAAVNLNKNSSEEVHSPKKPVEDSKSFQVKTISWKEPVASSDTGVGFKNSHRTKWNPDLKKPQNLPSAKQLRPIMKPVVSTSHLLPFVHAGEIETTRLRRSKQSSPLSYLIMHEDMSGVCQRHRRWLVKTPDYLP